VNQRSDMAKRGCRRANVHAPPQRMTLGMSGRLWNVESETEHFICATGGRHIHSGLPRRRLGARSGALGSAKNVGVPLCAADLCAPSHLTDWIPGGPVGAIRVGRQGSPVPSRECPNDRGKSAGNVVELGETKADQSRAEGEVPPDGWLPHGGTPRAGQLIDVANPGSVMCARGPDVRCLGRGRVREPGLADELYARNGV
jgi:hypothetical protein